MVPRNVCFVDGECDSVGSLTATSLTYSEDDGVVLSPPKRWNCDVGLEPKIRQRKPNVSKTPTILPVSHGHFRDPGFFPPFASMKSQLSLLESYEDDEDENDSDAKRTFSCNIFGRNRISTHTRMEMLRHQMSKPFRALPFPTGPKIDAGCIGKSILQSVANHAQSTSALDCNKSRKLVRQGQKEKVGELVEKNRFDGGYDEGYPSDEEMDRRETMQSIKDSPLGDEVGRINPLSLLSKQSFDFSIDKAELSLSNDTHWLSLVATDESSVEESAVVQKLELD